MVDPFDPREKNSQSLNSNNPQLSTFLLTVPFDELRKTYNYNLATNGVKLQSLRDYNQLFKEFLKEASAEGEMNHYDYIGHEFEKLPFSGPITMEMVRASASNGIRLPSDLKFDSDMDWSSSREVFRYLSFDENTFSEIKKEHLPEGYDPKTVFEKGMSIGLGIDKVHEERKITGSGIAIAVCDGPLKDHKDLSIKEWYIADFASEVEAHQRPEHLFHSSAVVGIAAGKKTGVAPDADVYYFAESQKNLGKPLEKGGDDLIISFEKILEINESLKPNEKIRVISLSGPLYGEKSKLDDLVTKLTKSGVWVFSSEQFWKNFGYLEKIDPMGDPNDFDNYQVYLGRPQGEKTIYVNSGDRTVPFSNSETAYRHDSLACCSWAIPAVVGYYALACQVADKLDLKMTPEKFITLARDTAQIRESTLPVVDQYAIKTSDGYIPVTRSEETEKIRILDIDSLLRAIEEEAKTL